MARYDCGYGAWIPGPVLDDPGLRPRSLILYARIARRANRVGFCYATNATLIEDMTAVDEDGSVRVISERTVQAMLAELQERGHIHTDNGPLPPDKSGTVRTGRRIYIGRSLAAIPDAAQGGEENFTPEDFCTPGVKKTAPPFKCIKDNNKNTPIAPCADAHFDLFWSAYPRHVDKQRARKAWAKLKPDEALVETILRAVKAQAACEQWTRDGGAYIPYPATWLNGRRWEDELPGRSDSDRGGESREVNGWDT